MTLGESIRAARTNRGMSLAELSAFVGISASYLGHLETGVRPISPELKESFEKVLGPLVEHSVEIGRVTKDIPTSGDLTIPLHWQTAPAGDLNPIVTESFDEFNVTKRYAGTFAVYIRGESMIGAGIEDGDIAVFREGAEPRNGQVVYACVNNMCTVKVYKSDSKGHVRLCPANKKYTAIDVNDGDALSIRGVLINVVREPKLYKEEE